MKRKKKSSLIGIWGEDLIYNLITIAGDFIISFVWLSGQFLLQKIKPDLASFFDNTAYIVFQILFFIGTLAPIAIQIYRHIRIMINKANKQIAETK